ncbi:MAG: D-alanyl-D-alanine carboxypeptidase family protein [Candidatus Paceibacteria bacterium]
MTESTPKTSNSDKKATAILFLIIVLALAVLGYFYIVNQQQISALTTSEAELQSKLQQTETELMTASSTIEELSRDLTLAYNTLHETEDVLRREQDRNEEFESQIRKITGTVQILDKLANTDKELLQKYSKVFFLNEHYKPERLREIDDDWKYSEDRSHQLHSQVMPFFEDMVKDAKADGVDLWVVSAYRSFEAQAQLKGAYLVTYGTGANAFSADQGYSEHQLGTAIDFTTSNMNGALAASFENTEAYKWLTDNAHRYGFTLSYPRGNAYYVFEPWHWRFVGRNLARDLKRDNAHFYDWEQRKIDEYLVEIFD